MFFQSFPPKPPPMDRKCSRWSPSTKCDERRHAQSIGEFFYSWAHKGWVWGEDRMVSKLMRDERKPIYCWPFCPWCGGSLPDLQAIADSFSDPPKVEGEDGG